MQKTVVLDGELSLLVSGQADCTLLIPESGEVGIITRYREADYPIYSGPTEVTPKISKQTLATKNKTVMEDITVLKIPYFETSNETGTTVYIANEV